MSAFHLERKYSFDIFLDRFPVIVTLYFKHLKTKKQNKITRNILKIQILGKTFKNP